MFWILLIVVIIGYILIRYFLSLNKEKNTEQLKNTENGDTAIPILDDKSILLIEAWMNKFFDYIEEYDEEMEFINQVGYQFMLEAYLKVFKELKYKKVYYENLSPNKPLDLKKASIQEIHEWAKFERRDGNFVKAIELVDLCLLKNDQQKNNADDLLPYLFNIRGKSNLGLDNVKEALSDVKKAYSSVLITEPDNILLKKLIYSRLLILQFMIKELE